MRFSLSKYLLAAIVAGSQVACVDALLNAAEEELLASAQADAAAKGGIAVLLTPGEATTVTITDENSPIFGATVDIPAGAVPDSAELPLLTIIPAGETYNGVLETGAEDVTAAGPGALITLQELLLGSDVVLVAAANVAMPFPASANVTDVAEIGHQLEDGTWETLEGSTVDAEKNLVAGNTLSFSPFMSIRRVRTAADINPYPGACFAEYFDASETLTGRSEYTYDSLGREIKIENENGFDDELDPPADSINEYIFDGDSKDVTFSTTDSDGDGDVDSANRHYTFRDAAGLITMEATDYDNDGDIDLVTHFENDGPGGQVSREESDSNGFITVYIYTYDANGFLVKSERQSEDGTTLQFIFYTNDALGLALIVEYSKGDNDEIGQRDEFTYDNRGNVLERAENVTATLSEDDQDGTPSYQRYNYDCWEQ